MRLITTLLLACLSATQLTTADEALDPCPMTTFHGWESDQWPHNQFDIAIGGLSDYDGDLRDNIAEFVFGTDMFKPDAFHDFVYATKVTKPAGGRYYVYVWINRRNHLCHQYLLWYVETDYTTARPNPLAGRYIHDPSAPAAVRRNQQLGFWEKLGIVRDESSYLVWEPGAPDPWVHQIRQHKITAPIAPILVKRWKPTSVVLIEPHEPAILYYKFAFQQVDDPADPVDEGFTPTVKGAIQSITCKPVADHWPYDELINLHSLHAAGHFLSPTYDLWAEDIEYDGIEKPGQNPKS